MPNTPKILVIGDSCVDVFGYCSVNRLCPDVPVPVLVEREEKHNPGMAMNLKANLDALGCNCDIETNRNWSKVKKKRFVHKDSNHTFFRVDTGENLIKRINLKEFSKIKEEYDLIAISDYNKGFLTDYDIQSICSHHPNVFIDTKKKLGSYISNAKFIKINTPEYSASEDFITLNPHIKSKIIRTAGGDGCYFGEKNFPVKKVEVRDVSGAGDTFFAGLIYEYCISENIINAIKFANKIASIVVQHKGVVTI